LLPCRTSNLQNIIVSHTTRPCDKAWPWIPVAGANVHHHHHDIFLPSYPIPTVHQAQSSSHLSITRYGNEKLQFNALLRPHLSKPIPQRDTPQYYYSRNQHPNPNQFPYPLSIPPHSRPKCRSQPPIKRHTPNHTL
jgi:hypothetical protein